MGITAGDPFPQVPVHGPDGPVDLPARWADGPLIVAFHRLWCPFCQEAAAQLAARRPELDAAGVGVVLVYPQDAATVARTCAERGVPFGCFADDDRTLERATGLERMRPARYLGGGLPRRLLQARRAGARIAVPTTDVLQGRGTYVVGADGRVRWVHIAQGAADIPPIDALVAAAVSAATTPAARAATSA